MTKTQIRKMSREELIEFGRSHCLLEHLDDAELAGMTKTALVAEVLGAFTRIAVEEEYTAMATDTVARPVAELIGIDEAPSRRKARKKAEASEPVVEAKAPRTLAPTVGEMTCRVCAETLPVTKFPTKVPAKDGTVSRDDRCRSCRDAAKRSA